jgi:hypothetical protein
MNYDQFHTAVKLILDKTEGLELPALEPEELDFWVNTTIVKFVKTRYSGMNVKGEAVEGTQKRIEDLRPLVKEVTIACGDPADSTLYKPNARLATIPDDYWISIGEDVTITVNGSTLRVGLHQIDSDKYSQQIEDPYSPHILHYNEANPLRLFHGNVVELIGDGTYTITSYHLRYIKVPLFICSISTSISSGEVEPGFTYLVGGTGGITYNGTSYVPSDTFVGVNGIKTWSVDSGSPAVLKTPSNTDLPEFVHDEIAKMAANTLLENLEQPRYQSHTIEVGTME